MIIGLIGQKGAGKSTAARHFRDSRNFVITPFAGPLKIMLGAYLSNEGLTQGIIHEILDGNLKESPIEYFAGRTTRHAMQTLGTEWGRELMHKDFWVEAWARRAAFLENVVVDDCRLQNEVDKVMSLGGICIRINRPGLDSTDSHMSETGVSSLVGAKYTIENDGNFVHLYQQLNLIWDIEVYGKRPGDPEGEGA